MTGFLASIPKTGQDYWQDYWEGVKIQASKTLGKPIGKIIDYWAIIQTSRTLDKIIRRLLDKITRKSISEIQKMGGSEKSSNRWKRVKTQEFCTWTYKKQFGIQPVTIQGKGG